MNSENFEKKTFKNLLKSNFKIIISFLFILFVIGISYLWIDYTDKNKKIKIAESFIEAKIFLNEENYKSGLETLKKIINKKDKIYSPLSLFLIIDKNLEKDKTVIVEHFNTVLSIKGLENEELNLLKLKKAIFISEDSNEKEILDLLNPIINSKSVWRYHSIKFLGDYYFSLKEFKKAGQYYSDLLSKEDENINKSDIKRKMKLIKND